MIQENLNKQIFITAILLIAVLCLFQFTNLDIYVQSFFYDFNTKDWFIDKNEPILRFFLYDGLKKVIILFNVLILIALLFFRKKQIVQKYKKGLLIVLLSSIFIPSIIGSLKAFTNTPCPCNIVKFGGTYPEKKVFDSYPEGFVQKSKVKCWPAGHASGGFALMSLFFLFKKPRNQKIALTSVLILAWSMGNYKMLLGDHFLSHTIITMLLAWLIILIIVKFISFKQQRRTFEKPTKI
ncbi:phosphatase PAP2 family protein [Arcobacter defluvii]|uniref:Phosphoesterase n=1 Tax=Arcobacter defluvii TaxID=873191 RepID=A0AAE7JNM6_9BACT|nr:phosphatase PAP2 family protein [Arcobacter defluvii]QKF78948.1 phosphoesterase [Arcobacter defluvii]RXI32216.1 phosphoesterase [Arcobacter defluvii]